MADHALRLTGATFGYATRPHVVTDAHLELPRGETAAIIGPSGGGKTTLLKGVVGLLPPSHGGLEILGRTWPQRPPRGRIGYIPQRLGLLRHATSLENAALGALSQMPTWRSLLGVPGRHVMERSHQALSAVGLSGHAQERVRTLSGGQQRRVAVARALVQRPELLVADEFLGELDPETARIVIRAVQQLQDEDGTTLLLVEHDLAQALDLADEVYLLKDGRLRRLEHSDEAAVAGVVGVTARGA